MDKLGIALFSYNRPDYFEQALKSLLANKDLDLDHVHLYQDKDIKTDLSDKCGEIAKQSGITNIHYQSENVGIARNQWQGYNEMFSKYERVLFLEDDMVLSSNYLELINKMLDQFMLDDEVWFVRGGASPKYKASIEDCASGRPHQWGHAFDRRRWENIKKYYEPLYMRFFHNKNYRRRDVEGLRDYLGTDKIAPGQDGSKLWSALQAGYKHAIETVLPRAKYIGEVGEHFRPHIYEKYGFGEVDKIEFDLPKVFRVDK